MTETIKLLTGRPFDITEDEFVAMAEARQAEYERNELLDRELGITEPEIGRDIHVRAIKILAARGRADKYIADEYVAACVEAGAR
jgi:hypothetical protein